MSNPGERGPSDRYYAIVENSSICVVRGARGSGPGAHPERISEIESPKPSRTAGPSRHAISCRWMLWRWCAPWMKAPGSSCWKQVGWRIPRDGTRRCCPRLSRSLPALIPPPTDPSNRQARSSYVLRYQGFAEQELDAALTAAGQLESELGAEGWAAVLQERKDLRLLLADSRLARDQIKAAMRETRERQEANLVNCPD